MSMSDFSVFLSVCESGCTLLFHLVLELDDKCETDFVMFVRGFVAYISNLDEILYDETPPSLTVYIIIVQYIRALTGFTALESVAYTIESAFGMPPGSVLFNVSETNNALVQKSNVSVSALPYFSLA